jgi:hypothetical protein
MVVNRKKTSDETKIKRGRKKKADEEAEENVPVAVNDENNTPPSSSILPISMDEQTNNTNNIHITIQDPLVSVEVEESGVSDPLPPPVPPVDDSVASKKRGRKPKGGKIITKQPDKNVNLNAIANIILHLKCSLNDLNEYNYKINKLVSNPMEYDPSIPPVISTYNDRDHSEFFIYNQSQSDEIKEENLPPTNDTRISSIRSKDHGLLNMNTAYREETALSASKDPPSTFCSKCNEMIYSEENTGESSKENCDSREDKNTNMKEINSKLKKLKIHLYKNQLQDKKSACFWCTYDYDNPSCYIPKYETDGTIYGYGSFCRPECAVAYLMKESIDDSMKFERYHLLNQIYSKVYDYKKNIKPAPNPYYLLEKFYGNLSIQEYRKLLKTEHLLLVIEKPMTRILPELHEDNESMIMNLYGGSGKPLNAVDTNTSGVYKVKRQSEKPQGPSKSSIIKDKFGIL